MTGSGRATSESLVPQVTPPLLRHGLEQGTSLNNLYLLNLKVASQMGIVKFKDKLSVRKPSRIFHLPWIIQNIHE